MVPGGLHSMLFGDKGPITFVSGSSARASTKAVTVTAPSGIQNDDLLIAVGFNVFNGHSYSYPAGWTQRFIDSSGNNTFFIASKVASAESGNYTFTANTGTDTTAIVILVYRNASGIDLVGAVTKATSTTGSGASITATKVGTLIALFASEDTGGNISTPPSGMTAETSITGGTSCIRTYDLANNPAGASGSKSLVWNVSKDLASILMQIY